MLNDRLLREHPDAVRAALRRRGAGHDAEEALDAWLTLDASRRQAATHHDALARAAARSDAAESVAGRITVREVAEASQRVRVIEVQLRDALLRLPNLPDARVPDGVGPDANVEIRRWGELRAFTFRAQDHVALGRALGILDLPRATRMAGPRFPLLIGAGARLARALATYMLDLHAQQGYVEVAPPHLLHAATLVGTGHLPHHAAELYTLSHDDGVLSPTAEVQLTALHADETLPQGALPLAYSACTPAFRREAGSTNATSHGLIRLHQFDKVELVRVATPETADAAFDTLVGDAERVLRALGLPYRVVALCTGELPWSAARTWDLEVWMPGQNRYVEISSVSDCGTYQARRLHLRYRQDARGRPRFPHTLNGSALPIGRTLAALLETYQRADGTVDLPQCLHAAMRATMLTPQ